MNLTLEEYRWFIHLLITRGSTESNHNKARDFKAAERMLRDYIRLVSTSLENDQHLRHTHLEEYMKLHERLQKEKAE